MSEEFSLVEDSPVKTDRKFNLAKEEMEGADLLEEERRRQNMIKSSEDSESMQQNSSNAGSSTNRQNEANAPAALGKGIDTIKEEEENTIEQQVISQQPAQQEMEQQKPQQQQNQSQEDEDDDYEQDDEEFTESSPEQNGSSSPETTSGPLAGQAQPPQLPPQIQMGKQQQSLDEVAEEDQDDQQERPDEGEQNQSEQAYYDATAEQERQQQQDQEAVDQEQYSLGGRGDHEDKPSDSLNSHNGGGESGGNGENMMSGENMISGGASNEFLSDREGGDEEGYIGEFSRDYINAEIFRLFDADGSGKITKSDLDSVAKQMGWNAQQMEELVFELDPNHDGEITEEEFNVICKYVAQGAFPPVAGKASTSRSGTKAASATATMHMYEQDKKRYGALLPKTGVYFLPDEKVLAFLRIMNQLRINAETRGDYTKAKMMKLRFEEFSRAEQQRQEQNMRLAQEKELMNIESAQKLQFEEFSRAWDQYMRDYESTAFELIEQLKMKQEQELVLNEEQVTKAFLIKQSDSKDLIEMRKQEKIFFSVKDYDKANAIKNMISEREQYETQVMEENLQITLVREMEKLRQKHQLSLQTLLKRIQRDREEQVKHRQIDSQRLIQRNKNLLQDILEKQAMEQRRTQQFLKFALGKREEKSEGQLQKDLKDKAYTPKEDSFLPRLKRKIGHLTGEMQQNTSTSQRNAFSTKVSIYDNNSSISGIRKEKYTLVKNPLRTKMSTLSSGKTSNSFLGGPSMHTGFTADPTQVLKDLKLMQKNKIEERKQQYSNLPPSNPPSSLPSIAKKR